MILRSNWLKAFVSAANRPGIGLVGESIGIPTDSWELIEYVFNAWPDCPPTFLDGEPVSYATFVCTHLRRLGIDPGVSAEHLQSLILCARREVLEAIGGFRIGLTYEQATLAEIGISKSVEATGRRIRQVGFLPFTYIHHPQWDQDRLQARRPGRMARKAFDTYLRGNLKKIGTSLGLRRGR